LDTRASEDEEPHGKNVQHRIVTLERCRLGVLGPVRLEGDLRHTPGLGPFGRDEFGTLRASPVQVYVGIFGADLIELSPGQAMIVEVSSAGEGRQPWTLRVASPWPLRGDWRSRSHGCRSGPRSCACGSPSTRCEDARPNPCDGQTLWRRDRASCPCSCPFRHRYQRARVALAACGKWRAGGERDRDRKSRSASCPTTQGVKIGPHRENLRQPSFNRGIHRSAATEEWPGIWSGEPASGERLRKIETSDL